MNKTTKHIGEYRNTPANTDKWLALKSEDKNLENEIDEQVYNLYGLTREELAIKEA